MGAESCERNDLNLLILEKAGLIMFWRVVMDSASADAGSTFPFFLGVSLS